MSKVLLPENSAKMKYKSLTILFDKAREKDTDFLKVDEDSEPNNPQYYKPKITEILPKLTKNKLFRKNQKSPSSFKKYDIYPNKSESQCFKRNCFKKKGGLFADEVKDPVIIFFVIGGISYNEVAALSNMEQSKSYGDFRLIVGGTGVYSPYSYIKKYSDLSQERKEKAVKERELKLRLKKQKEQEEANKNKNKMFAIFEEDEE